MHGASCHYVGAQGHYQGCRLFGRHAAGRDRLCLTGAQGKLTYASGSAGLGTGLESRAAGHGCSATWKRPSLMVAGVQALDRFSVEKDLAAYIKKEFDKKHNPTWHCIVGRNFGACQLHRFAKTKLHQSSLLLDINKSCLCRVICHPRNQAFHLLLPRWGRGNGEPCSAVTLACGDC